MQADYDVIIVGGAAAGLTAALYAARRELKTVVITKTIGGQLAMTPSIENFPGTKQSSGIDLMMAFQDHAKDYGAEFAYETVSALKKKDDIFTVTSTNGTTRTARAVILAFGLTPKNLEVPGEQDFQGKGVVYCATCDAPLFRGKDVAVVGGTYEALDAALLLAKMDCNVTLIHKKDNYPTYKKLFAQVQENDRITLQLSSEVKEVVGSAAVEGIVVTDSDGAEKRIDVQGVFVEMGHKIDSAWVGDLVEYDKKKSIVIDSENNTKTPGLFAAGDVTPLRDKQAIISAGEGAKSALSAYHYLQKLEGKPVLRVDWQHTEEV